MSQDSRAETVKLAKNMISKVDNSKVRKKKKTLRGTYLCAHIWPRYTVDPDFYVSV